MSFCQPKPVQNFIKSGIIRPRGGDSSSKPQGGADYVATPIRIADDRAAGEILVVDVKWLGATALVQPWGELDLASAETLRAELAEIGAPRSLVLDMRGLSFIDSAGLHLLTELHGRAAREGFELEFIAPPAPADRAIRVCGLDRHMTFVADPPADELAA
jgi:anti-sigma B factor antagonist